MTPSLFPPERGRWAPAPRTGRSHRGGDRAPVRCPSVKVEVVRSSRRRKTVQAREVDGVLRVSIPATMSAAEEARWVDEMTRRMKRRAASAGTDLAARASALARRHGLQTPTSIRWADNQEWRWGSCTPADRSVRISSRLTSEPAWVLDYVIVHELAHLEVARHGPDFWAVVNRYPLAERARGFLMARGLPSPADPPGEAGPGVDNDGDGGCGTVAPGREATQPPPQWRDRRRR